MFHTWDYLTLQQYWWFLIAVLAGLLVFGLYVQWGQVVAWLLAKTKEEKEAIYAMLSTKYHTTFTTLVVFWGAFFASFPLFYSTSFWGAFYVWLAILFLFIVQAVAFKYRTEINNFLGEKIYNIFLLLNWLLAPFLLGVAVGTFFTWANFIVEKNNLLQWGIISQWANSWHWLEALWNTYQWWFILNIALGLTLVFLSMILGTLFIINTIKIDSIQIRARNLLKKLFVWLILSLVIFLIKLFTIQGFAYDETGKIYMEPYKYFKNLWSLKPVLIIFLLGALMIVIGTLKVSFKKSCDRWFWVAGLWSVLVGIGLFLIAGYNNTAFYPSLVDLQSSLTIQNASSSKFTLIVMSYVSLLIPFVIAYIARVWYVMTRPDVSEKVQKEGY